MIRMVPIVASVVELCSHLVFRTRVAFQNTIPLRK